MHLTLRSILVMALAIATVTIYKTATAQAPDFDRFFGSFNPPEYIPIDITADNSGNIYVLDIYHERIRKLDQLGNILDEIILNAKWLRGIEVDSLGNIYIVDAAGATSGINSDAVIYKHDPQGNLLELWPSSARGIGIDASDKIYTVSEVTGTVSVLDTNGNLLLEFGAGILSQPEDVDATQDGAFIYVADSGNARIAKFDASGNFLTSWGSYGTGDLQFNNPVSLTVDQSGNIFVTDRRNYKIKKFDTDGNLLAMAGGQGTGPGLFQEPHGNTVDPFGNVWLATYHGHDVQKFDNNLSYLLTVAGTRSAPGEFADVRGVDVDSERNVYIADKWLQRVTKFDRDGNYIMDFGERGQGQGAKFNFPRTVHIDNGDNIYVSDDGHVRKFDTDGNYITRYGKYLYIQGLTTNSTGNLLFAARTSHHKITRVDQTTLEELTFGTKGTGPGEFDGPWGVAVGPNGFLYVADSNNARIQRFTLDGVYDMEWGSFGTQPGQFKKPTGLVIDAAGNVYVGDAQNDNIQVFDQDGNYLYGWGSRGSSPSQFNKIWSLALEEDNAIYAGDVTNSSTQRFTFDKLLDPVGFPAYLTGADRGFFIGNDGFSNWEIHWNGNGPKEVFSGTINCDNTVTDVSPWRYEPNDILNSNDGTITFSGIVRSGNDGFTFSTPPGTSCDFNLLIDDKPESASVFIGNNATIPTKLPFQLTSGSASNEQINPTGFPSYTSGIDRGFFIGTDGFNNWRIDWSGNGPRETFTGTISCDSAVTNVEPWRYEPNDTLTVTGGAISFSGIVSTGNDGLTFTTPANTSCDFNLLIDGTHYPGLVYIGENAKTPSFVPFQLTSGSISNETIDATGKPQYTPGVDLGAYLWYENSSGLWKLRLSTINGQIHTFTGAITTDGTFTGVTEASMETQDTLNTADQTLDFEMKVTQHQDGFNFGTQGASIITINVLIDGVGLTGSVHVGSASHNPQSLPFILETPSQ